jgi:3-hydroxyacyl-[acyl-carrier-protein] dehydratase
MGRTDVADTGKRQLDTADIEQILKLLPHRYPMLLVDRIIEMDGDESCIGIKGVTYNEPHFQGHFPGRPVMPGVLIIEGMTQTAGALAIHGHSADKPQIVYFVTIDNCKFRKPVIPGDRLEYHLKKIKSRRGIWWYRGEAKVDGEIVAEAEVSAMLVDR